MQAMDKDTLRVQIAAQFLADIQHTNKNLLLREKCKLAVHMTDVLFEELDNQVVKTPEMKSLLSRDVRTFEDLSVRAKNCLISSEIYTIGELVLHSKEDLQKMRNMGRVTISHLEVFLDKYGLYLGMSLK